MHRGPRGAGGKTADAVQRARLPAVPGTFQEVHFRRPKEAWTPELNVTGDVTNELGCSVDVEHVIADDVQRTRLPAVPGRFQEAGACFRLPQEGNHPLALK